MERIYFIEECRKSNKTLILITIKDICEIKSKTIGFKGLTCIKEEYISKILKIIDRRI